MTVRSKIIIGTGGVVVICLGMALTNPWGAVFGLGAYIMGLGYGLEWGKQ